MRRSSPWHSMLRLCIRCMTGAVGTFALMAPAPVAAQSVGRDSAGVRIVESADPRWSSASAWRVAETPAVAGASARVGVPLREGRSAVPSADGRRVDIVDTNGAVLRSVDFGSGGGQRSWLGAHRLAPDSLIVAPFIGMNAVAVFTPDGVKVREVRWSGPMIAGRDAREFHFRAMFSDGSILVVDAMKSSGEAGFRRDSVTHLRLAPDGTTPRLFAELPGMDWGPNYRPVFGPVYSSVLAGDEYYHGLGDQFRIDVYRRDGTLARSIRRAWTPQPPAGDEVAAARGAVQRYVESHEHYDGPARDRADTALRRRQGEQAAAALLVAPVKPAFSRMLVDAVGHLWVRHHDVGNELRQRGGAPDPLAVARWSVFDPAGRWLGELAMPAGLDVHTVRDTHVIGTWHDPRGAAHTRVHAIIKP